MVRDEGVSAGSWTPSVRPRVRTRQTVNASGGAERTAPLIRHRRSDHPVAQLMGAVARSTRGDVLIKSTIAGGCVYHASRLRPVGRDLADAVPHAVDVVVFCHQFTNSDADVLGRERVVDREGLT